MDEILWCYHSNETSSAVLSHGTIYLVCCSNFWVYGSNPAECPFKWNLFSSTFTRYYYCLPVLNKTKFKILSNFDFCWEWKGCYCRFSCVLIDNIILLHTRGPVSPGGPGGPGVPAYPWNENTDGFHFHAIQKSNTKTISKGTQLKPTLYSVSYIASGKVIWIPECRKFWLVESGVLA